MSTRPCPTCGSPLLDQARFCGQCGTTIAAAPPPAAAPPADVHEELTVPRAKRDLSAMKTIMDSVPYGSSASGATAPTAGAIPTPVVPSPDTQAAPVVVRPQGAPPNVSAAKTMLLAQTMNDPEAQARAREMLDAAMGSAATAQAKPASPKANLHKTMMMGGENAVAPLPTPAPAPAPAAVPSGASPSDHPTPAHAHPSLDAAAMMRGGDASPMSKSVLAPQTWQAPEADHAAHAAHAAAAQPAQPAPNAAGVEVARVVAVGGSSPAPAPADAPTPAAVPAPAPTPRNTGGGSPALRTMLGMPASDLGLPPNAPSAPLPGGPNNVGGTMPLTGAPAPHNVQKTMLGVAIPGIAPTQGAPPATDSSAPPSMQSASALASKQSTMLGVAIPGIAPTHQAPPGGAAGSGPPGYAAPSQQPKVHIPSQVQNTALGMMAAPEVKIVPRPKTLIDEPLPVMPQIPEKKGVSALAVVGIVFAILLLAGGGIGIYALRSGGALTAVPQLDENGRESLKIGCPSCPDGTTVALGASSATVTGGAAVLPLPAPLSIGENDLGVKIERPAGGRNEEVKVHVPVAYRVRADLSTLSAKPPAITVRIEATPGSTATVEGKPIALDATGRGAYAIDLAKETDGPGEAKTFERKIPFAITPKGGKEEAGQLTARTGIVPLVLDAPGHELVTDKGTAPVAGQTRAGTTVTIDGQNVPVDAAGIFGVRVELAAVGDKPLEIVASAPPLAPRIAKVKITRVASLQEAAKAEDAQSPIGFDVFGADPAAKAGQKAVVEGEVVDARAKGGHTVLLIEDKKKCAKGASCLVRVIHGEDDKAARGDTVRAYGRVLGAVTASGKTVPDIEAIFVLPIKAAK